MMILPDYLGAMRHILIDEVQDLVGYRAEFVLALLEATDCGFTLFGDPAQSIYGFQLGKQDSDMTSTGFFRELAGRYGSRLKTVSLSSQLQGARQAGFDCP